MRRAKMIATIGPGSDSPETLDGMIAAGMRVARLNASHAKRGDYSELQQRLENVRAAGQRCDCHVAVLLDLGGPKLRIGDVAPGVELKQGGSFDLVVGECEGSEREACVSYEGLPGDVSAGDRVLIDDGRIVLRVESKEPHRVRTTVEVGGPLLSRKGVNVPGVSLSIDAITPKDYADLAWGLDAGVDLIAQSFVRTADDIGRLRDAMGERALPIIAKVEKHEAVSHMREVVASADAVMVARGDLAVETSTEQVPVIQKQLIMECRRAGKPCIIATQMLESMITALRPTRAEATDVANAIFQSADVVMLSAETATGEHPVEVVRTMASIVDAAEQSMYPDFGHLSEHARFDDITDAVSGAVYEIARDLDVAAILCSTESGTTARAVASKRPEAPVIAVTPNPQVARQLMIVWGVDPLVVQPADTVEKMFDQACDAALQRGLVKQGDLVAFTSGAVVNVPGQTNLVQVNRVR